MPLAGPFVCVLAALWIAVAANPLVTDTELDSRPRVILVDRQISQLNSRWLVRYQIRYEGRYALELGASDLGVDYDAWVANSRSRSHAVPRKSQARFALAETNSFQTTVIANSNDRQRCRERISLAVSTGKKPLDDPTPSKTSFLPVRVAPRDTLWVYLTLDHEHFLHGKYDPLLGEREVELSLGPCRLVDSIPLVAEQSPATPPVVLSTPPKERMDTRQSHSGPDSLYLAADVPGYQYFRFDDMQIRHGTRFRLSFWYLIALGTEGSCHVRVMEYQDTPNAWYRLEGGFDEQLTEQGRWRRFEQTFTALDDTTTMALDFRIVGANVGEMWIDDVELVPLYADATKP